MTKKVLTPEQVERLHPVARHLERAVKGGEVVGITNTEVRTVLFPIYKEVFGDNAGNTYCNHCIMKACQRLGVLYLAATETAKEPTTAPNAPEVDKLPTGKNKINPNKINILNLKYLKLF